MGPKIPLMVLLRLYLTAPLGTLPYMNSRLDRRERWRLPTRWPRYAKLTPVTPEQYHAALRSAHDDGTKE